MAFNAVFMCVVVVGLSMACSPSSVQPTSSATTASPPAGFVNRVWTVRTSNAVQPGTIYVFLSDGTLLITSSTGTPALGKWTYAGGAFTMIEEGLPYKVDILSLSHDEFRIRSNNPGTPVEVMLVPADTPPLTP